MQGSISNQANHIRMEVSKASRESYGMNAQMNAVLNLPEARDIVESCG